MKFEYNIILLCFLISKEGQKELYPGESTPAVLGPEGCCGKSERYHYGPAYTKGNISGSRMLLMLRQLWI